jgi:hypothetical protein
MRARLGVALVCSAALLSAVAGIALFRPVPVHEHEGHAPYATARAITAWHGEYLERWTRIEGEDVAELIELLRVTAFEPGVIAALSDVVIDLELASGDTREGVAVIDDGTLQDGDWIVRVAPGFVSALRHHLATHPYELGVPRPVRPRSETASEPSHKLGREVHTTEPWPSSLTRVLNVIVEHRDADREIMYSITRPFASRVLDALARGRLERIETSPEWWSATFGLAESIGRTRLTMVLARDEMLHVVLESESIALVEGVGRVELQADGAPFNELLGLDRH